MKDLALTAKLQLWYKFGPDYIADKVSEKVSAALTKSTDIGSKVLRFVPDKVRSTASYFANRKYINECLGSEQLNLERAYDGFREAEPHGNLNYNDYRPNVSRADLDTMIAQSGSPHQLLTQLANMDAGHDYNHVISGYVRNGSENHLRLFIGELSTQPRSFRVVDVMHGKGNRVIEWNLVTD
jgi:hypothetical protein